MKASHYFLIRCASYSSGCLRVENFLNSSLLVKYDRIEFFSDLSLAATEDSFHEKLRGAQSKIKERELQLLEDLSDQKFISLYDVLSMPQGYPSKTFHMLAHLLDGFFGVDSYFYNLEEDSHGLSSQLANEIRNHPEKFWLIAATGVFAPQSGWG